MDGMKVMDKHGPSGPGRMVPGRRSLVMVMVEATDPEEALQEAMGWVEAFEEDCGLAMDRSATELYGVARATDLKETLRPPRDAALAADIDFICAEGRWHHPGDCPVSPPDDNGAPAWSWAYYRAVMAAEDEAVCTIWDVLPLPAAA